MIDEIDVPAMVVPADAPVSWLEQAHSHQMRIARLKTAMAREEAALDECLSLAQVNGDTMADLGYGILRLVATPGRRSRVLDTDRFKAEFPKAFKKCARYVVTLADAEREIGQTALDNVCTIKEGAEKLAVTFTPTADPLAREVTEA